MSRLKAEASWNMPSIVVTPEVSHAPMSWSNDEASLNIHFMFVTPEVSHALMSSLKDEVSLNNPVMSVTPDVSQIEMWPYDVSAALASAIHAATAVPILLLVITQIPCTMPHDVDAHGLLSNALSRLKSSSTHQPRSWSKAEALSNIRCMLPYGSVTL
jgi:hypothetical protein